MFTVKAVLRSGSIHLYQHSQVTVNGDGTVVGDGETNHFVGPDKTYESAFVTNPHGKTVSSVRSTEAGVEIH